MADKVRSNLEKLIPELLALEKKRIFTTEDIKQIMQEREKNEYLLQRKNVRLKDFLKVIDYEYQLERRRKYQHHELGLKRQTNGDFASQVIKRIIQLWDKIMNKYRYNIELWKQYLGFCYQIQSKRQFNKAITQALKLNPYEIDLWLLAAYYEFDTQKNPFKARKIFYSALKMLKNNKRIWAEYLGFEIKFSVLLQKRENFLTSQIKTNNSEENGFISFKNRLQNEDEYQEKMLLESSTPCVKLIQQIIEMATEKFPGHEMKVLLLQQLESEASDQSLQQLKDAIYKETLEYLETQITSSNQIQSLAQNYFSIIRANIDELPQELQKLILLKEQKTQEIFSAFVSVIKTKLEKYSQDEIYLLIQKIYLIIKNDTKLHVIFIDLLPSLPNEQSKQFLSEILNKSNNLPPINQLDLLTKLLNLGELQTVPKLISDVIQKLNKGLWKVPKENLCQFLMALNKDVKLDNNQVEESFSLAKKQLITDMQLYESYLDSFFGSFPHYQEQFLQQLIQLNKFCPLKYHLLQLNRQPLSKQGVQVQKIIQCFGNTKECWKAVFEWASVNCPSKLNDLYKQGQRESQLDFTIINELYEAISNE